MNADKRAPDAVVSSAAAMPPTREDAEASAKVDEDLEVLETKKPTVAKPRAQARKTAPVAYDDVELVDQEEGNYMNNRVTTRSMLFKVNMIKTENLVEGQFLCPKCGFGDKVSTGCNVVTCRNHRPQYHYLCIHCKQDCKGGIARCSCSRRNTSDTRIEAQKRRNKEAAVNPIDLQENEDNDDSNINLNGSDESYSPSEVEDADEDDSSKYASDDSFGGSDLIKWNQERKDSDGATRPTKRLRIGRKDIEKWNQRWDRQLEQLKKFKAEHGHCRVPKSSGALYLWLIRQRNQHLNPSRKFLEDVSERKRRTKALESVLGTSLEEWRNKTNDAIPWDQRLEELKQFEAKHGHCNVPRSSGPLYKWLNSHCIALSKPASDRYLKDKSERERRTEALESVLGTSLEEWRNKTNDAIRWNQQLEELKQFEAKHGHCKVPTSFGSLCGWLRNQRNIYLNPASDRYLEDVSERERRTEALELVLGTSLEEWRKKGAIPWDQRLEELKQFEAKNGHCNVPTSSGSLYGWLRNQRNIYLNPASDRYLEDVSERDRRTRELELVLGTSLRK